jgi:hypothetical protein
MKYLLALYLAATSVLGSAQTLRGFSCEGRTSDDDHIWRYRFEINEQTSKGVWKGLSYGDIPFTNDIEVVFTPERMQIRKLGAREFVGYIDRRNLSFNVGGAVGTCKMVPVKKPKTKF